jgi:hypothetical protein
VVLHDEELGDIGLCRSPSTQEVEAHEVGVGRQNTHVVTLCGNRFHLQTRRADGSFKSRLICSGLFSSAVSNCIASTPESNILLCNFACFELTEGNILNIEGGSKVTRHSMFNTFPAMSSKFCSALRI